MKVPAFLTTIGSFFAQKARGAKEILKEGDGKVTASFFVMGLGQMLYRQYAKGALYLIIQILFVAYFVLTGAADLFGLFTLGSKESNEWYGVQGDNSVVMLIMGLLALILTVFYLILYF